MGPSTELGEQGGEKSATVLLSSVLEIEEEIGHGRRPPVGGTFNTLDDGRASGIRENKHF